MRVLTKAAMKAALSASRMVEKRVVLLVEKRVVLLVEMMAAS